MTNKQESSRTFATCVEFPLFRAYESSRQRVNNGTMALLAGSKLALHTLQLTKGSELLLPEIFPGVDHIRKFNLTTEDANEILLDAANHLGAVTIPYVLAIHTNFVMETLKMLEGLGYPNKARGNKADLTKNDVNTSNMHEAVHLSLGMPPFAARSIPTEYELFDVLRAMRNSLIHAGGRVTSDLKATVRGMSSNAKGDWLRLARRDASTIILDNPIRITTNEIFTTFAVTKKVGRTLNAVLQTGISTSQWARICVDDFDDQTSKFVRSDPWARSLLAYGAQYYAGAKLDEAALLGAAEALGYWDASREIPPRRSVRLASIENS